MSTLVMLLAVVMLLKLVFFLGFLAMARWSDRQLAHAFLAWQKERKDSNTIVEENAISSVKHLAGIENSVWV